jgi:hypothetical protein
MKYKKELLALFFLLWCCISDAEAIPPTVTTSLWDTQKSTHFIVYYQEAPPACVEELINKAEGYYSTITEELGFTRYEGFWTWDNRARIYLFKDKTDYQKATDQPVWSGGETNVITREIYTYIDMKDFFRVLLPHELGHIIFREFIGYKRKLPLWLDEGVASFLEKEQRAERLAIAKGIVKTSAFMSLEELSRIDRKGIIMPALFYAEAASTIEFLFEVYGKDKFVEFCRCLKDLRQDQPWEEALRSVYGFKDVADMDAKWEEYLRR